MVPLELRRYSHEAEDAQRDKQRHWVCTCADIGCHHHNTDSIPCKNATGSSLVATGQHPDEPTECRHSSKSGGLHVPQHTAQEHYPFQGKLWCASSSLGTFSWRRRYCDLGTSAMHLHKIRYGGSCSRYLCTTTTFYARVQIPKLKDKQRSLSLSSTHISSYERGTPQVSQSFQCHPTFFVLLATCEVFRNSTTTRQSEVGQTGS